MTTGCPRVSYQDADLRGLQPEMLAAVPVLQGIWAWFGLPVLELSTGVEGKHSRGSLHYVGFALDVRGRNIDAGIRASITEMIRQDLGSNYDVLFEEHDFHWHLEFQPKKALNR